MGLRWDLWVGQRCERGTGFASRALAEHADEHKEPPRPTARAINCLPLGRAQETAEYTDEMKQEHVLAQILGSNPSLPSRFSPKGMLSVDGESTDGETVSPQSVTRKAHNQ